MESEGIIDLGDGRQVGWLLRGPEGGRPAAWLHGQPGSRLDVRALSDEILERWGLRFLAIDRAGYGETSSVGLDRRDVAKDLFVAADHVGWNRFPILAVSMGGVYALTAAAIEPRRVSGVVLASGHVLPYDDLSVIAGLSDAEKADLEILRQGPDIAGPIYAAAAAQMREDPVGMLRGMTANWSDEERAVATSDFGGAVGESVAFGLAAGHQGLLEDGLRSIRPLEVMLSDIGCRVVAIHGDRDDLEPYANVQRLLPQLPRARSVVMPGLGHFAPWVWPELPLAILSEFAVRESITTQ